MEHRSGDLLFAWEEAEEESQHLSLGLMIVDLLDVNHRSLQRTLQANNTRFHQIELDEKGNTLLHLACLYDKPSLTEMILKAAKMKFKTFEMMILHHNNAGEFACDICISLVHVECLKTLLIHLRDSTVSFPEFLLKRLLVFALAHDLSQIMTILREL